MQLHAYTNEYTYIQVSPNFAWNKVFCTHVQVTLEYAWYLPLYMQANTHTTVLTVKYTHLHASNQSGQHGTPSAWYPGTVLTFIPGTEVPY